MRSAAVTAATASTLLALLAAGCSHAGGGGGAAAGSASAPETGLSPAERQERSCRRAFAQCAPPASFARDTDVHALEVRTLVQMAWRLDLPDDLSAGAARRLRTLAERGDLATVEAISAAADAAAVTLGRCRCEGERFRPEYEKQRVADLVARRLPRPELRTPAYWADRVEPHLAALRTLSRRAAAFQVESGARDPGLDDRIRDEERGLCEELHAARDVLTPDALSEMRALVDAVWARASGEASAEAARRTVERLEREPSCGATGSAGSVPAAG